MRIAAFKRQIRENLVLGTDIDLVAYMTARTSCFILPEFLSPGVVPGIPVFIQIETDGTETRHSPWDEEYEVAHHSIVVNILPPKEIDEPVGIVNGLEQRIEGSAFPSVGSSSPLATLYSKVSFGCQHYRGERIVHIDMVGVSI